MLHVQLDTNWIDNEKVMDAGWEGAGVHAGIMCLAKRLNTDGWVPLKTTVRYLMPTETVDLLVDLGLLESDGARVRPNDWHERNPTKAAIAAKREAKVRAGKAGTGTSETSIRAESATRKSWKSPAWSHLRAPNLAPCKTRFSTQVRT